MENLDALRERCRASWADGVCLTINMGSSSLKAALYRQREDATEAPELRTEASRIGGQGGGLRLADARD